MSSVRRRACFTLAALAAPPALAGADVRLPALVGSHMVLQRDAPARVWGWAAPGEAVRVSVGAARGEAVASADGRFRVDLPAQPAGGPFSLTVAGRDTVTLEADSSLRPLVADFDLALNDAAARKAFAARLEAWEAANDHQDLSNEGFAKGWAEPDADTAGWERMELPQQWEKAGLAIDGAAWFRRALEVPAAWAGKDLRLALGTLDDFDHYGNGGFTGVAPDLWIGTGGEEVPLAGAWHYRVERSLAPSAPDFVSQPRYPSPDNPNSSTVLYGALLAPLTPLSIRGAIWYQGESNAGAAFQYRTLFPAMIRDWRRAWGRGDFPFLFVPLAGFMPGAAGPGDSAWAELREAQAMTLAMPKTGMAVAIDIGEAADIHPKNKKDVGDRLALWALADTYEVPVAQSGPLYRSSAVEGGAIRVRFEHAQELATTDGAPPRAFAVAGADRNWRWAEARIDGETVVVSSPQVPQPVAVRYAWADNREATLRNGAGLPASPFRTDDWPMLTAPRAPADGRELELLFKRNGQPAIREDYVTFGLVDRMEALFDTRSLKATGPLPAVAASGGPAASIRNPVIPGFHPDPSVVRVGRDFYLVTSSFEFFPGVPIFTSRDLVSWKQVGHVLTRESQLPLQKARPSGGIYAPTLRYHDGTFYLVTTNVDGGGNFYVTAKDPAGPWSEPVWLRDFGGIDPSLFFDDDGTVYLTGQGSGAPGQPRGIYQTTLDVKTGKLREPLRLVWDRTGTRYPEGPHLYKIEGRYYLMIAEGGTEYGHMITIARSDSPWGPFEACPRNPILTNRQTENDVPVQGTGHADLVEAADGSWWMVFLAFRPVSGYWHHLGRETFLAPVAWDADGWPVVNGGHPAGLESNAAGLPAEPLPPPSVRTGFDAPLGPEWNYLRHPRREAYALDARPGWLTLHGEATSLGEAASPTWVGRRQQHLSGRAATLVDFVPGRDGEEAGVSVYMNPDHRYEIGVGRANGRRQVFVRQRIGAHLEAVTASAPLDGTEPVVLQVDATPSEYAFSFGVALSGKPQVATRSLGKAAVRYLSSEVAGGFTGVYFGLYATGSGRPASAPAHFDWFDYEPRPD